MKSMLRIVALGLVFAGAIRVECRGADVHFPLGGLNHPRYITYYHPGFVEANGLLFGYGIPGPAYPPVFYRPHPYYGVPPFPGYNPAIPGTGIPPVIHGGN